MLVARLDAARRGLALRRHGHRVLRERLGHRLPRGGLLERVHDVEAVQLKARELEGLDERMAGSLQMVLGALQVVEFAADREGAPLELGCVLRLAHVATTELACGVAAELRSVSLTVVATCTHVAEGLLVNHELCFRHSASVCLLCGA